MSRKQRFSAVKGVRRQKNPTYHKRQKTITKIIQWSKPVQETQKKTVHLSTGLSGLEADTQRALSNDFFAVAVFMVANLFFAEYTLASAAAAFGYQLPLSGLFAFALLCLTRGKGLLFAALITLLMNFILA